MNNHEHLVKDLDTLEQMAVERVSAVLDKEVCYGTVQYGSARHGTYGTRSTVSGTQ